ncbi:MAG: SpoIID/LytB domain-containing protein [Bacteroidales bacterium]|jgi:SpoIID/LytB domain protein|nr:SpoIID/LytB domain-containing protein [Bacteroidales bacterium]
MKTQPKIEVGILACEELQFILAGSFEYNNTPFYGGEFRAILQNNQIVIKNKVGSEKKAGSIHISPIGNNSFFELKNVTIGVNFHWEQQENQRFRGSLKLVPENGKVRAINLIDLEEYLKSVISSEMSETSSLSLLKAHAVISRSWLLAQIEKTKSLQTDGNIYQNCCETEEQIIRWYNREDHNNFDVCADDHCQRYQGVAKMQTGKTTQAVEETFGEVLMFDEKICDARYSKCCGGITESFENVWEPVKHDYLTKVIDNNDISTNSNFDLRNEANAENWIRNSPPAFCNTADKNILEQVLPKFDQTTTDFFRWKIEYSQNEIAGLLKTRSGIDFGEIINMEPVERGVSGRLSKLKITGTKKTLVIGKELEIRKWLSKSHLYSSAFVIDYLEIENGIPQKFVFTGAGWGHGVGLCQMGAAVMSEKGYFYIEILNHYFKGAELKKYY